MALTLPRWIAAACIGALVSLTLVLSMSGRPTPIRKSTRPAVLTDAEEAQAEMGRTRDRLALLRLRDSLLRVASHESPDSRGLIVLQSESFDAALKSVLDSTVAHAAVASPTATSHMPVIVAFVERKAPAGGGTTVRMVDYVLPAAPNSPCLVMMQLPFTHQVLNAAGKRAINPGGTGRALLGPCAFYRAFGMPGERMSDWLMGGGLNFATSPDWRSRPLVRRTDVARVRAAMGFTNQAVACLVGRADFCERQFLDAGNGGSNRWGRIFSTRGQAVRGGYSGDATRLGAEQFLSGLVITMGPERFARAWQSPLPVASAFEAAGTNVGEAMRDWMQRTYPQPPRGPSFTLANLLAGFLTVAGAIAVIAYSATRRQTA